MSTRLKPYPSYKDSGLRWLERMPEDWQGLPLKRWVATKITDGPHTTPEFQPEGVEFISAEAVQNSRIDFDLRRGFISQALHEGYCEKCRPVRNDVLLCKSGATTGKLAIVETDAEFSIWSPLAVIRADASRLLPRFLFWSLQSDYIQNQIRMTWSAGTQPNIAMSALEVLFLSAATHLDEQRAIASFLDRETGKIDALVAKKERLIELLQEKRTALISHAVTQGLNPNAPTRDSGIPWLGRIPEHWGTKRFKFFASVRNGQVDPEDQSFEEMVLVAPNHIESGTGRLLSTESAKEQGAISGKYFVEAGEIIYSKIRPALNKAVISRAACLCSADMYPIRVSCHLEPRFLLMCILGDRFVKHMVDESMRVAMPKVNRDDLYNCWFPVPPLNEQRSIVSTLDAETAKLDALTAKVRTAIGRLQEYRTALISAAVTGQIDVRQCGAGVAA